MARCVGTKRDGKQCTTIVKPPLTHCYQHDPEKADERRRNASKAGRVRPSKEIASIKVQLAEMVAAVLSGAPTAPYAVANQLINTRLRAVELERKIREQDELEARIEELERSTEPTEKRRESWGT